MRRHLGVDDSLSPTAEEMASSSFRLYDLFSPNTYEYIGTVQAPDRVNLMAGDQQRVAGIYDGPFGKPSLVVLRWAK